MVVAQVRCYWLHHCVDFIQLQMYAACYPQQQTPITFLGLHYDSDWNPLKWKLLSNLCFSSNYLRGSRSKHSFVTMTAISVLISGLLQHWSTLICSIILLSIISTLAQILIAWNRLRHIKGPPFAAFSDLWLARHVPGGRMHLDLVEVCEKYGTHPSFL